MTIKEIAQTANVDKTTVQRWIKRVPDAKRIELDAKCTKAQREQKEADFSLEETLAILRAGGNETLADLLAMNAKAEVTRPSQASQPAKKLPSGAQMTAMLKVYGQAETVKRLDFVIGYKPQAPASTPIPACKIEPPAASPEEIEMGLRSLIPTKGVSA